MSYPKFPKKYGLPSAFSAADLIQKDPRLHSSKFPEKIVICFQKRPFQYLVKKYRGRPLPIAFGELFELKKTGGTTGVAGEFGIGAPISVFIMEWLAALGAKEFVVAGFAGGLKESQRPGDLVVCSGALRDEGTSYHYLPPDDFVDPDPGLSARLSGILSQNGYAHEIGRTWTTDAPFRETFAEVEHYRNNGLLTVEMEAAALFAAARSLNVSCAAAFTIGDTPKDGGWQTDFDRNALHTGLERIADAAVAALSA